MRLLRCAQSKKGISVIEVMVAVSLLLIVLVPLLLLFETSLTTTITAGNLTTATQLANGKIESLRTLSIDTVIGYNNAVEDYGQIESFSKYRRVVRVEYLDSDLTTAATPTNLVKLTVTVFWRKDSVENKHSESTLISR